MLEYIWGNLFIEIWQLCIMADLFKQWSSFNCIRFITVTIDITLLLILK